MATSAAHPYLDSGFGQWLKQARKARGLTLADISRETKIPLRNLEALEHGDLGAMPAFYERAEVRAVARAVGLDERLAIGRLDTAIMPVVDPPAQRTEDATAPGWKTRGALVSATLAVGFLLAAIGIGRAVFNSNSTAASSPTQNAVAAAQSVADSPVTELIVGPAGRDGSAAAAPQQIDVSKPATEPVAPAAASTASSTEILVMTDPPGAHVTVNGISWGVSPVTIRHLEPGNKRIRATKEGFAAVEQVLVLGEGQRQTLIRLPGAN